MPRVEKRPGPQRIWRLGGWLLALAICAAIPAPTLAQPAGPSAAGPNILSVLVEGVTSTLGHVRVDVCTHAEFLKDCRYSGASLATLGTTIVEVRDVPTGVYAVQAYQDRNDNTKVDQDFLGFPLEPVGFSNDAPVHFGPPKWKAAAFQHDAGPQTIHLLLRRFHP